MSQIEQDTCQSTGQPSNGCVMSRRDFMVYSGVTATAVTTTQIMLFPGTADARMVNAKVAGYPRKLIAKLSELQDHTPVAFNYPDDGKNSECMLVKMGGLQGGGGIGAQKDVVAFSYLCTHQGGPLQGTYKVTEDQCTLGQCPLHLSVFDLRRHGIIVSGQAYQSLPNVLLELDGDDIYAVGMMGLLFGRSHNLMEV